MTKFALKNGIIKLSVNFFPLKPYPNGTYEH
jgi:hypothetical protein